MSNAQPFVGRFAGYAAVFGRPDAGGDVIRPGAFAASLAMLKAQGEPLPLFWQHRPEQAIGWVEHVAEDGRGLRVIARLANPEGASAAMLASGEVSGLSFGYRAREAREIALPGAQTGRELSAIDLFEISLVTNPMQDFARVHLVV
jgi:HK97 family phage prohead protease